VILGIDIGTTAVKGVLLDELGHVVAEGVHHHDISCPTPGMAEAFPEDWWQGVVAVCAQMLAEGASPVPQAIGVSGMVPVLVLLDDQHEVIRPSIQQNDARAAAEIADLRRCIPDAELFEMTGSAWNQQLIPPKALWLQRHEPGTWGRVRRITGSYEYVTWKLTGISYAEANWALESGLWSAREEDWVREVLDAASIPQELLAPVCRAHDVVGGLRAEAARELGLPEGTPVIAGSADHIAAMLPLQANRPGHVVIKLGGAGDLLLTVDSFVPVPSLYIDYHCIPGRYVINGCMATSGTLLKWFSCEFASGAPFEALDRQAAVIPPGSNGLITLPYFLGEKTPIHDPAARGTLIGLTLSHSAAHVYRSILEGIAYAFKHHVDVLRDAGHVVSEFHVTDGGARSPLWRSILASVLGHPLSHRRYGHVGSAVGVALLTGVAIGLWTWESLPVFAAEPLSTPPDLAAASIYERSYDVYREVYRRLQDLYPSLMTGVRADGA
jgi:xylulokinase